MEDIFKSKLYNQYLDKYIDKYYDENNIRRTVTALMGNDTENNLSSDIYNFLIERKNNNDIL